MTVVIREFKKCVDNALPHTNATTTIHLHCLLNKDVKKTYVYFVVDSIDYR